MLTTPLTLVSPAKLNLFLHITGRLPNGYHTLQTLFQLLDYGDTMEFQATEDAELRLSCNRPELQGEDNLVLRAARALQRHTGSRSGAHIHLHKRIASGAGLGGGSSNAATTLLALNHLWQTGLDRRQLGEMGLQLGADVPVFVEGRTAWAEGIGEQLTPVVLPQRHYVVLSPPCHVATAEIFSHQQLTRDTTPIKMAAFLAGQSGNDCEALVRNLYADVDAALDWLEQFASARMTGTGASVFASFSDSNAARAVLDALSTSTDSRINADRVQAFMASGIAESPLCAL